MALIRCRECRKLISDKAAVCPKCGCPTGEPVAASSPPSDGAADAQILALVEKTLDELGRAEEVFKRESDRASALSSATINWNAPDAKKRITDILAADSGANGNFYIACQGLIGVLDGGCRPLLAERPGANAVKAVAGTVALLNEKSRLESSVSLTLNREEFGQIEKRHYLPGTENLAIQGFWEAQYAKLPNHGEAEAFWRNMLSAQKQKGQAERESVKQQALSGEELYQSQLKKWQEEVRRIEERRDRELSARVEEKRSAMKAEIENNCRSMLAQAAEQNKKGEDIKKKAEEALASLGVLHFSGKSEQKKLLKNAEDLIASAKELAGKAEEDRAAALEGLEEGLKKAEKELKKTLEKEYPLPKKPFGGYGKDILDWMGCGSYTPAEITAGVPSIAAAGLSSSQVAAILCRLVAEGRITRVSDSRDPRYSKYIFVDDMLYTVEEWRSLNKNR